MAHERSSLPKRVKRYAKVSTAMAGFGARAAGKRYLGINTDRQKQAERLRVALGGLKGPLMKVAQLVSTIPDIVPKEYAAELAQLQADAPSMGWPFVKRRMTSELGPDWESKFKNFEHEAAAAASLGQVHRATAHDGRALACKLQYPDMLSTVEADLRQLKLILGIFERTDRAVSTKKVHEEISDRLHEELDYRREAKHIALYRHILADTEGVQIPEVVASLSTDRLLTMTWLEGDRLPSLLADMPPPSTASRPSPLGGRGRGGGFSPRDENSVPAEPTPHLTSPQRGRKRALSLKDRNAIAINMFRAWYTPFYYYGVIHGDPHLGNYTVRKDNSLNLLDFGCIRVFKPALVAGVITLYTALRQKDRDMAAEAYKAWGFKNPSKALVEILNIWAQFIYAPLLEDKTRLIEETNTGVYGRETAAKVHDELRKLGGVEVPREFVFMDRAAVGLGAVFLRLGAEINWYKMFHELIENFDVKELEKRQTKALKAAKL